MTRTVYAKRLEWIAGLSGVMDCWFCFSHVLPHRHIVKIVLSALVLGLGECRSFLLHRHKKNIVLSCFSNVFWDGCN